MNLSFQKGFSGIDENLSLQSNLNTAKVIKDLRILNDGSIKKRNAIEVVYSAYSDIKGLWCGKIKGVEYIIFIFENMLFKALPDQENFSITKISDIDDGDFDMFEFGGMLYIKSTQNYYKTDGDTLERVNGYIPCVAINCSPLGEGEVFEEINLICPQRRQLFSGTGTDYIYKLAEDEIISVDLVKVNGITYTGEMNVNELMGEVQFPEPLSKGLNNIEITYTKRKGAADIDRIFGCKKIMLFGGNSDGRAFLWGNDKYPNYRFHSDLANGVPSVEYFPVNAYTIIGNGKINCIVQQYDKQLIFNENEAFYSFCELRENLMGDTISSFPVYNLNSEKGCLFETRGCIIDNKPVTLCQDGLNIWESTSVQDERNARCFSKPIKHSINSIIFGANKNLFMFDHQAAGEFYFIADDTAYVYNYCNNSWYTFSGFKGKYYCVLGNVIYFSDGRYLKKLDNRKDNPETGECFLETSFIDLSATNGGFDIVGFEADLKICPPVDLGFVFEKSNGDASIRQFSFSETDNGFRRISLRPAVKRGLPFKIKFFQQGEGFADLFSLSIKTRKKERSNRNGIHRNN